VLKRVTYDHPLFTPQAIAAQRRHHEISGVGRTHYCGAYWRYGFHEDGVVSALPPSALRTRPPECTARSTAGGLSHRRMAPQRHAFRYPLFMLYLDLAELDTVFARRWLWSTTPAGIRALRSRRPSGGCRQPLDEAVRKLVGERLGSRPRGPIRLLTHLRYGGYVFNPVSFYYCFDADDRRVEASSPRSTTPLG
jgi:hypothetical protein